jgi:hypothetical protein
MPGKWGIYRVCNSLIELLRGASTPTRATKTNLLLFQIVGQDDRFGQFAHGATEAAAFVP